MDKLSKRVMVIDLSRTIRTLILMTCHQHEHQSMAFASHEEAMERLPLLCEQPPDLAFVSLRSDYQEQGRQVVQRIRQLYGMKPTLIAMIGREEQYHRHLQQTVLTHAMHTLIKPFLIQDVVALLNTPLAQSWQTDVVVRMLL